MSRTASKCGRAAAALPAAAAQSWPPPRRPAVGALPREGPTTHRRR